jgi:hypothetical protein
MPVTGPTRAFWAAAACEASVAKDRPTTNAVTKLDHADFGAIRSIDSGKALILVLEGN